jgi:hypothetical protein
VAQLPSPPLLWRYGRRCDRMIGVISDQGMVPVLLLTVHGHFHSVNGSEYRSWDPHGSPSRLRVPRAPRARQKRTVGCRALLMTPRGSGKTERCRPRPLRKAQVK